METGFDKRREKTLLKRLKCIVYTINADPYPESDSLLMEISINCGNAAKMTLYNTCV